jgi:hypothetical protein
MTITNSTVAKIFDDLDQYRDFCRFEGHVFNEAHLYNHKSKQWQAYQKYQRYLHARARNKGRNNA